MARPVLLRSDSAAQQSCTCCLILQSALRRTSAMFTGLCWLALQAALRRLAQRENRGRGRRCVSAELPPPIKAPGPWDRPSAIINEGALPDRKRPIAAVTGLNESQGSLPEPSYFASG